MTILKDVLAELIGMFIADAWLSTAILAVVLAAAALTELAKAAPLVGGVVLLVGCIGVVVESVRRAGRRQAAAGPQDEGRDQA